MKLVTNADDFGMNENVSMAIVESFKRGYINQTTLMVNMPWAEQAVELAIREGIFSRIGLHLNLTAGKPLTGRMANCSLFCNSEGVFDKRFARLGNAYWGYSHRIESIIHDEVEAQVKKYCKWGFPLLHLDSHHHIHHRLPLAGLILPLVAKYDFKTIRLPYSIGFRGVHACVRKGRNAFFRYLANRAGIGTTDEFGTPEALARRPEAVTGANSVELMVHPYYDAEGHLINIVRYDDFEGPLMEETDRQIKETICQIS